MTIYGDDRILDHDSGSIDNSGSRTNNSNTGIRTRVNNSNSNRNSRVTSSSVVVAMLA